MILNSFLSKLALRIFSKILNDRQFAILSLLAYDSKDSSLASPENFNEKIYWLMINDRRKIYTELADKITAKKYVSRLVGSKYVIPNLAVWKTLDGVNFNALPEQFVLKSNNASGTNIIVKSLSGSNIPRLKNKLQEFLSLDMYSISREWVYRDIEPCLFAEELLLTEDGSTPLDYKFFCFMGNPVYVQVDLDRFSAHTRCFFDMNWEYQDFNIFFSAPKSLPSKPPRFDEMKQVARELSSPFPFVRIDLYSVPDVKFGEFTFFPDAGRNQFTPTSANIMLGSLVNLSYKG